MHTVVLVYRPNFVFAIDCDSFRQSKKIVEVKSVYAFCLHYGWQTLHYFCYAGRPADKANNWNIVAKT